MTLSGWPDVLGMPLLYLNVNSLKKIPVFVHFRARPDTHRPVAEFEVRSNWDNLFGVPCRCWLMM